MNCINNKFSSIEDYTDKSEDFFRKIKTISELFMYLIEIEMLDERVIFLAESMALCIQSYENTKSAKK